MSACDHDAWYLRRRVMDPMFHRNHLKSAVATFNSAGDNFLKDLQTYAESGDSCGLSHLIEKSTLDVIMKVKLFLDTYIVINSAVQCSRML